MRLIERVRLATSDALRRAGFARRSDLEQLRVELDAARGELDAARGELAALTPRVEWLGERTDALEGRERGQVEQIENLKNLAAIEALSRWLRHTTLQSNPLVSVVMPTRDRVQHLPRAIESVLAQRYENWELLVIDDGGSEDSSAVAQASGDPRISWSQIPHGGVSAARNAGLGAAKGELIVYLDDDNVMDPDWLFAVVWAFEQRPDVDVVYGAFVVDDYLRITREASGALPWTFLHSYSRDRLRERNLADIGAIAHRSGLPDARFDEAIQEIEDWDMLLRLTAEKDPLVLPAIACYYTTDAPGRMTKGPSHDADVARVIAKARGFSPQ